MLLVKYISLCAFLCLLSLTTIAQVPNSHDIGNELRPKEMTFSPRLSLYDLPKGYYTQMLSTKVEEYQSRMKNNVKKHIAIAKAMKKPQYSDPLYFGHKKKPKKRSLKKRRLCAECAIVH